MTGCAKPNICLPIDKGTDGNVCPASCSVECPENSISCDGGRDSNNCKLPNTCVSNSGN